MYILRDNVRVTIVVMSGENVTFLSLNVKIYVKGAKIPHVELPILEQVN